MPNQIMPNLRRRRVPMIYTLRALGLTSGLKLCLDAGDVNSYDGSSQTWADISGGGYSFYRGTGSGSDGADPTFNGVAGRQSSSDYFSFDGGDYFTLNQANPTWVNNLHKNSAKFTFLTWVYINSLAAFQQLFATGDSSADVGTDIYIKATTGLVAIIVYNAQANGAATTVWQSHGVSGWDSGSGNGVDTGQWNFVALSLDEPAGTIHWRVNDATRDITSIPYENPSSAGATLTPALIGYSPFVPSPLLSGSRLNTVDMWEGVALTEAQISAIYEATKAKFGL